MSVCGIYGICCFKEKKHYIGQSQNITSRWTQHVRLLNNGNHHSSKLQEAWDKYGITYFTFITLKMCDKKDLDVNEAKYVKVYQAISNGYNMSGFSLKENEPVRSYKLLADIKEDILLDFSFIRFSTEKKKIIHIDTKDILKVFKLSSVEELIKIFKMIKQKELRVLDVEVDLSNINEHILLPVTKRQIGYLKYCGEVIPNTYQIKKIKLLHRPQFPDGTYGSTEWMCLSDYEKLQSQQNESNESNKTEQTNT